MKPKYVVFRVTEEEFIELGRKEFLKQTGIDYTPFPDYDEETNVAIYYFDIDGEILNDDALTDEENQRMIDAGYNLQEPYVTTDIMLCSIFNAKTACTEVMGDNYEYIDIFVDYDSYMKNLKEAEYERRS